MTFDRSASTNFAEGYEFLSFEIFEDSNMPCFSGVISGQYSPFNELPEFNTVFLRYFSGQPEADSSNQSFLISSEGLDRASFAIVKVHSGQLREISRNAILGIGFNSEFSDKLQRSWKNLFIDQSPEFHAPLISYYSDQSEADSPNQTFLTSSERSGRTSFAIVEKRIDQLYEVARNEVFKVGYNSQFSSDLQRLFEQFPFDVMRILKKILASNKKDTEILAEILRWVSRQESLSVRNLVIDILSTGLYHQSSLVRDAAANGIADIDEKIAVGHIELAIDREKVPELRTDMRDLLRSLSDNLSK